MVTNTNGQFLSKWYRKSSVLNRFVHDSKFKTFLAFCVSYVPQQGTVGCSGDLCPLAHLALGLLGEGKMWSPLTGLVLVDSLSITTLRS